MNSFKKKKTIKTKLNNTLNTDSSRFIVGSLILSKNSAHNKYSRKSIISLVFSFWKSENNVIVAGLVDGIWRRNANSASVTV